ncbi:TPA_asm: hypothetical protein [Altiarchaeum virus]|nr:TPA_asm: hypothetical protein [Altiarchaeum virus]
MVAPRPANFQIFVGVGSFYTYADMPDAEYNNKKFRHFVLWKFIEGSVVGDMTKINDNTSLTTGLDYTKKYAFCIAAAYGEGNEYEISEYTSYIICHPLQSPLPVIQNFSTIEKDKKINLSWDASSPTFENRNFEEYVIYRYEEGVTAPIKFSAYTNAYIDTNIEKGKKYAYTIATLYSHDRSAKCQGRNYALSSYCKYIFITTKKYFMSITVSHA